MAALSGYVYGIGEGVSDLICVTISTGIGGGIKRGGLKVTERISQGEASCLYDMEDKNPEMVAEAVEKGDDLATHIIREVARCLGLGLSSLINIFSARLIILGGGVTNALYLMLPTLYLTIRRQAEVYIQRPVSVVPAALGG